MTLHQIVICRLGFLMRKFLSMQFPKIRFFLIVNVTMIFSWIINLDFAHQAAPRFSYQSQLEKYHDEHHANVK